MKLKTLAYAFTLIAFLGAVGFTASRNAGGTASKERVLAAGKYTAKAKALVCGGCVSMIRETLEKNPGIESVSEPSP